MQSLHEHGARAKETNYSYSEGMALASSFKLAFQVSLTGCIAILIDSQTEICTQVQFLVCRYAAALYTNRF